MRPIVLVIAASSVVLGIAVQRTFGEEGAPVSNLVLQGNIECIYFSSASFSMGCPNNLSRPLVVQKMAQPERTVQLSGFYLGKFPVTVEQFAPFLNATGLKEEHVVRRILLEKMELSKEGLFVSRRGMGRYPVTGVTHDGAKAFCIWLTAVSGHNCRLPSEAEWEYAARGKNGRVWPWGNVHKRVAVWSAAVGQYPELATPDGIHDLDGPVFQWCVDAFDPQFYSKAPQNNPVNEYGDGKFVYRGGPMGRYGWFEALIFPPTWKRFGGRTVEPHGPQIGFRIAISPASGHSGAVDLLRRSDN